MVGSRWGWSVGSGTHGSVVLRTTNGGRSWEDKTPPSFSRCAPNLNDDDTYSGSFGLSALDSRQCWIAFDSSVGGHDVITVEQTADGGRHWRRRSVKGVADSVILQFLDARHGVLLALGGPAAGLMGKDFYSTDNGGTVWTKGGSPDRAGGNFYPTGMAFRNPRIGWIAATYHGTPDVPLFRTDNGGKTWHLQALPEPAAYQNGGYGNTYPPHFFGPQRREGTLVVNYRNDDINRFETVTYVTRDGGYRWRIGKRKRVQE